MALTQKRRAFHCVVMVVTLLLVSSTEAALKPRSAHPYLYFNAENIARLKARIGTEKSVADAWARSLDAATGSVDKPNSGGDVESLSLAYRMTGDKKFAEKVRAILLREIQRHDWGSSDLLARNPPWHAGLGTARSCYTAAVGFDSIYDTLSEEDRKTIAKGIVDLGILPTMNDWVLGDKRIHSMELYCLVKAATDGSARADA